MGYPLAKLVEGQVINCLIVYNMQKCILDSTNTRFSLISLKAVVCGDHQNLQNSSKLIVMSIPHFILLLLDQEHEDGQDREVRNAKKQDPLSPTSSPE